MIVRHGIPALRGAGALWQAPCIVVRGSRAAALHDGPSRVPGPPAFGDAPAVTVTRPR